MNCLPLPATPFVKVAAALFSTKTSPVAADSDRLFAVVFNGVPLAPMLPPVEVRLNVLVVSELEVAPVIEAPALIVMLLGAVIVPVSDTVVPAVATRFVAVRFPVADNAPVLLAPLLVVSSVIVLMLPLAAATLPDTVMFCP